MTPDMKRAMRNSAAILCALAFPLLCAADYPDRPVRIVVAQPAGGNADLVSRSFAQKLTDRLNQLGNESWELVSVFDTNMLDGQTLGKVTVTI